MSEAIQIKPGLILDTSFQIPRKISLYALRHLVTIMVVAYLAIIVGYFYIGASSFFEDYVIGLLVLTLLTDGVYIYLHIFRRSVKHGKVSFDPTKLTIVIACYNGEKIIGETITQAMKHVPANQILVVSDASKDNTVEVAKSYGVRVHQNTRNVNKAFSISGVMHMVETPYVLVLDDDTLIGDTFIPTSLLDEGYAAVAFNVIPVETGTLVNRLQMFEYRKSMLMGKALRGSNGAVGNVSGAIGLYWTNDLQHQTTRHSGQFGGEDQQRTCLVHLHSHKKGVTYTNSTVRTMAPDTWRDWIKQRSVKWNLSTDELFVLYWRVLLSPRTHYLLKFEKVYQIYIFLTDPFRLLFLWLFLVQPQQSIATYFIYVYFGIILWIKTRSKDPIWVPFIFSFYSVMERMCRLYAQFHWFKVKHNYVFRQKFHQMVEHRKLLLEYSLVVMIITFSWIVAITKLIYFWSVRV
jgi:glycosyltransferase involved in cell wall biosynthesis